MKPSPYLLKKIKVRFFICLGCLVAVIFLAHIQFGVGRWSEEILCSSPMSKVQESGENVQGSVNEKRSLENQTDFIIASPNGNLEIAISVFNSSRACGAQFDILKSTALTLEEVQYFLQYKQR